MSPLGVVTQQTAPGVPWFQGLFSLIGITTIAIMLAASNTVGSNFGIVTMLVMIGFAFMSSLIAIDISGSWMLALTGRIMLRRAESAPQLIAARMILESPRIAWRQVSGVVLSTFLAIAGTPTPVQVQARSQATLTPVARAAAGSAALAALLVLPMVGTSVFQAPLSIFTVLSCIAAGIGAMALSLRCTLPLLRKLTQTI